MCWHADSRRAQCSSSERSRIDLALICCGIVGVISIEESERLHGELCTQGDASNLDNWVYAGSCKIAHGKGEIHVS